MERSNIIKRKKHTGLKIFGFIVLFLLVFAITLATAATIWYKNSITAIEAEKCSGESCKTISFIVEGGDATAAVAKRLEEQGIIKSALAFRIYVMLEAKGSTIKTGNYDFSKDMSVAEIVKSLDEGVVAKTFRITFLPGATVASAKARLKEVGYEDAEIDAAFKKNYDHPLLKSRPAGAPLEGYIYPETYEFYTTATVEEVLERTFDEMYKVVKDNKLVDKYKASGFTLHQGITLASVVQSEAGIMNENDQRTVAQVFLTRLARKSVLGSDAIIAYRADQLNPNRDKTDTSYINTIECPWNSRKCAGLPPTPISNPGKTALLAVANPSKTDYYYFISGYDKDGKVKMYYARTEAEHQANIDKYCGDLCQKL